jgi:hypothetical protein
VACRSFVAAREAFPRLMGFTKPLLNPASFETLASRSGLVVVVLFGVDHALGSPGNLKLVFFISLFLHAFFLKTQ